MSGFDPYQEFPVCLAAAREDGTTMAVDDESVYCGADRQMIGFEALDARGSYTDPLVNDLNSDTVHDFIDRAFDDPSVIRVDVYTDSYMGQRPEVKPATSVMLDRSFTPEAGDLADAIADQDLITVDETTQGGRVTLHFPAADAGRMADVYMFSAARLLAADATIDAVNSEGQMTVTIPTDIEPGEHRVAVVFHDDGSLRWDAMKVIDVKTPTPGTNSNKPKTGDTGTAEPDANSAEADKPDMEITTPSDGDKSTPTADAGGVKPAGSTSDKDNDDTLASTGAPIIFPLAATILLVGAGITLRHR